MASHDIEVFGKAASGTGSPSTVRGDCPFSQRTYIDLEEKGVSYKSTYIQEGSEKPQWFMENNPSGLMPVLRDGQKWVQDSDKIIEYLDEQFPDSPLKGPENLKSVGAGVFQNFTQWLQAKDANSPTKHELEKELQTLEEHLKTKGPFVAGEKFTDLDSALGPKLLHARVALQHFYGFKFPESLSALKKYMENVENRQSFKNTSYPNDMIVKGWQKKFELPNSMVPQEQSA